MPHGCSGSQDPFYWYSSYLILPLCSVRMPEETDTFVSNMISDQHIQGDFKKFLNIEIKEKGPVIVPGAGSALVSTVTPEYRLLPSNRAQDKGPWH